MHNQFLRFSLVGAFNTVGNFLLLNILIFWLGFSALPSNLAATAISLTISFYLNYKFVFKNLPERKISHSFAIFVGVNLFSQFIVSQAVFWLALNSFKGLWAGVYDLIQSILPASLTEQFFVVNFSKVVAVVSAMGITYFLYKVLVFQPPKNPKKVVSND